MFFQRYVREQAFSIYVFGLSQQSSKKKIFFSSSVKLVFSSFLHIDIFMPYGQQNGFKK